MADISAFFFIRTICSKSLFFFWLIDLFHRYFRKPAKAISDPKNPPKTNRCPVGGGRAEGRRGNRISGDGAVRVCPRWPGLGSLQRQTQAGRDCTQGTASIILGSFNLVYRAQSVILPRGFVQKGRNKILFLNIEVYT